MVKTRIFFRFSGKNIILCILKGENSQEFALDGGVLFDTLAKSDESHADKVFISALLCSI